MVSISGVIMSKNEGDVLAGALEQLSRFCDDIVVIDVSSTDNTREVCAKFPKVHVYSRPPALHEKDREFAFSKMKGDWGFLLDPDERLEESLLTSLHSVAEEAEKNGVVVVFTPRRFMLPEGRPLKCVYPDYQARFFKKDHLSFAVEPHGKPTVVDGKYQYLSGRGDMIHNERTPFFRDRTKFWRWVKWEVIFRTHERYYFVDHLFRCLYVPIPLFLYHFVWKRGFLDGIDGFLYALFWARYRCAVDWQLAKIRFRRAIRTLHSNVVEDQ